MSNLILVWGVLKQIGALVEVPDDAPIVVNKIVKHVYTSLTDIIEYKLVEADYCFLNDLFAKSNLDFKRLISGECTQADYEQFKQAFNNSTDKPDWRIQPYFYDATQKARTDRSKAIYAHTKLMERAAVNGEITLLSETYTPIFRTEYNARISREDAERYLRKYSLPLTILDEKPAEAVPQQAHELAEQGLEEHEYTKEQQELFDPLNWQGLAALFDINGLNWDELCNRKARNGLNACVTGNTRPAKYNPAKVMTWLLKKGKIKQTIANTRLKNNLPPRSKDKGYLIVDDY